MSKNAKKKLCWSCEGRVAREAENCPYCGVYLSPNVPEVSKPSVVKPLVAPYTIPTQTNAKALAAPYQPKKTQIDKNEADEVDSEASAASTDINDLKAVLTPLVLLLAGSVFFLFGTVLYFFSQDGAFTLHWNGDYWMYYFVVAVPMLFLGWRSLGHLKDAQEDSE